MTQAQFKRDIAVYGDCFYKDTCPMFQAEIIRKIMNGKAMNDFDKMTALTQYINNLCTNKSVVENIKQYNNR